MAAPVAVLDLALESIERQVAAHPPERGGALLGLPNRSLIVDFAIDEDAETSSVTYRPSERLAEAVRAIERTSVLRFMGIAHSHPGTLDSPAPGDLAAADSGLRKNPQLAWFAMPIVTSGDAGPLAAHEQRLPSGKLSWFCAVPQRDGPARVGCLPALEVPLARDLRALASALGIDDEPDIALTELAGVILPAGRVTTRDGTELLVIVSDQYPALPPVVLRTLRGDVSPLEVTWRLDVATDRRLVDAVVRAIEPRRQSSSSHAPAPGGDGRRPHTSALGLHRRTLTIGRALLGLAADLVLPPPPHSRPNVARALLARSHGLLPPTLLERHVLVLGAGSVGSYVAEQLTRSGVGSFRLVDFERVEPENLSRAAYTAAHVGRSKVSALAAHLRAINPNIRVATCRARVQALGPAGLDRLVRGSDLVIAATDDPSAQALVNRVAYHRGVPAVFPALTAGARGGEVIVVDPERTPCYGCAAPIREVAAAQPGVKRELDYGSGRLRGEMALSADIQHVASAAVKLALSLLVEGEPGAGLGDFARGALRQDLSYLCLSMTPRHWFFPEVIEGPGQYAYAGVWLTPERRDDCPVCGSPQLRVDPLATSPQPPDVERLRSLAERQA